MPASREDRAGALVIHPGALGDVLLAVPALRALGADGAVTLLAQPRLGRLLVALGVVAHAEPFDGSGLDVLFTHDVVRPERALGRLAAAARVVCWFGARDPHFVARLRALAPDAIVAPPATAPHVVWRHLAESIGQRDPDRSPVIVSARLRERGVAALRAAGWDGVSRFLVVHPGAGSLAKRWPAGGFAALLADVDDAIVVHEGPADADAVDGFIRTARRRVLRIADPPLDTLAGILAVAAAYVGNDSGVSHLAATVGTRSLVLFTEALLAWIPWSPTASCVRITAGELIAAEQADVRRALRAML
jgi:heptosyltransferase III